MVPVPICGDPTTEEDGFGNGSTSVRKRKAPIVRHIASQDVVTISQDIVVYCAKAVGLVTPSTAVVDDGEITEKHQERSSSAQRMASVVAVGCINGTALG